MKRTVQLGVVLFFLSIVGCAFSKWLFTGDPGTGAPADTNAHVPIVTALEQGLSAFGEATLESGPVAGWVALVFTTIKTVLRLRQAQAAKTPTPPAPGP